MQNIYFQLFKININIFTKKLNQKVTYKLQIKLN